MYQNVFLYWIGHEYKLISILRNLIYFHSKNGKGYKVHLITDKNIKEYIPELPEYFYRLNPAHQADFVRVCVVCDYGGIWLDSDTLVMDKLDSLFDIIETKKGFFIKQNNTILSNGIFGSQAKTPIMTEWKTKMIEIFNSKKQNIGWSEVGNDLLQQLYDTNKILYNEYTIFEGLNNLYPVNWDNCVTEFIDKPFENYKNIVRNYQPLIVLVNSVYKRLESKTEKEIMEGNMPLNYFLNKSLENKYNFEVDVYSNLVNSSNFIKNLKYLNISLKDELIKHKFEPLLIGNLFYDHEQEKPVFYDSPLLNDCNEKRIRFTMASKMRNSMFEIGVNGGHSSFLALMSNEKINVYANDIAEFYSPCHRCHPEIYVLKAVDVLKELFNERFRFIKGSCLTEVPKFVESNKHITINLVHIDGDKITYKQDFFNIMPLLEDNAIVIFDDSNMTEVQNTVDYLIDKKYLYRMSEFPKMSKSEKYTNEILLFKKQTQNNKQLFSDIYEKQIWNGGNPSIPLSGPGSSIQNTSEFSRILNEFIYKNSCKSILDLGCGDLTWIPKSPFFNDDSIKYTGVDVVKSLIKSHTIKYPTKHFLNKDITLYKDMEFASMIIIRDVIFHLKNDEILSIFNNIKSKFEYIAITSCKNQINSDDFNIYRFSEKNIHKEPFNKNYKFQVKIIEDHFNRSAYIYAHDDFYESLSK